MNDELQKFYADLLQEISAEQQALEEGATREQVFVQYALNLLADAGETENFRLSYDEKLSKRGIEHKVNAHAIADNYETLDLFIAIFYGDDEIRQVAKNDADTAANRATKFFRTAVYKDYKSEIEPSSEIFDLAHTLAESPEIKENLVRVNVCILTDGVYSAEIPAQQTISGTPIYFRVVDISYIFNLSAKSRIPIEIDFLRAGYSIPCIPASVGNETYQVYLAVIPALALAGIYEKYGSRLLEQNVRAFLQFTGKINKGIRATIQKEPEMFLAYNNGIAATAEEIILDNDPETGGKIIASVKDLQIVNGGQTTASIYHTWKKDKADISKIGVQLKLSVVRVQERFSLIVSKISEYANTQNRVSVADLSSNQPFHIELEKLSRAIRAPLLPGQTLQTRWFYERARGQYKNARLKEGFSAQRRTVFDKTNPKNQLFVKEDLAKFCNAWKEVYEGKKLVIAPHFVVRGSQKNYVQFMQYGLEKKLDSIYFEDVVAKAILFRTAEKLYGVKPNAIGDLRYIVVPYTVGWLSSHTKGKLDLGKIWKNQSLSESLSGFLYELMQKIDAFIRQKAPASLYGEWAKKEECWLSVREQDFGLDLNVLQNDLDKAGSSRRKKVTDDEMEAVKIQEEYAYIKSVSPEAWQRIELWGKLSGELTANQRSLAFSMPGNIKLGRKISHADKNMALRILEIVQGKAPELIHETHHLPNER